ncbi:hypothetical protein F5Y00DRAFT_270157 [Daldinia vernicosa]|uniref:uncharacterized protein n=1 Tax=Daldinia vernicosa TaxID=114800 RepID=UPI00200742C6|nr:uncharacterized protein F5Y00DRAFT_270157 [Daldinia vernicosa]KAI0848416.1 hypothetical protein F5Y00DRAFT_270157 [Daldinia vernicosa]
MMGFLSTLKYRRPAYVNKKQFLSSRQESESSDASLKSGQLGSSSGIPEALTFDRIISGGTCPPCTVRDFMNYLLYIEHSAENLQFFLWYRDYTKRFDEADTLDAKLSPEWTQAMEDESTVKIRKDAVEKMRREPKAVSIFKGTDFEKGAVDVVIENGDPFLTPPSTPNTKIAPSLLSGSQASSYRSQSRDAFSAASATQPFTIQPFRAEIDRVIATYIAEDAPRQLNLSSREQKGVIQALAYTTHPSAFRTIARSIEATLRRQAHPNFIRWTICNGNPARVTFALSLGVGTILSATAGAIVLTLSSAARGWRALFAIGWVLGIATLIAARKGMCVVLHGLHHRQVRPWELFFDSATSLCDESESEPELGGQRGSRDAKGNNNNNNSFDSFGSDSNSYEDEPWVVRYERRGLLRKVFDREVWIREPALRRIQDVIFVQALLGALVGAGLLTGVFVSLPAGRFF